MARLFHLPLPHHRDRGERPGHPATSLLLILLIALLAALWMQVPTVASLLPVPPPA
jgi:hypothetical protein